MFKFRGIKFVNMRYLPDRYLLDLGAQYVYPESVGSILNLEKSYTSMERHYHG